MTTSISTTTTTSFNRTFTPPVMSTLLTRLKNKRQHIADLERFLTWDYDEKEKAKIQRMIDEAKRDLARYYR